MAAIAANCGKIWISRSVTNPIRRPLNLKRLNAYAANAPSMVARIAVAPAMIIELTIQLR